MGLVLPKNTPNQSLDGLVASAPLYISPGPPS